MKRTCKGCGITKKEDDCFYWFSHDYCGRGCATNKADELKRDYWEIVRLLKEK